jgi:ubiquinone/menaquinone biosynthesis C-methylase UbiE
MTIKASDHWSDYWSRACLTSLPQDFAANYDGEVAAFWRTAFGDIPDGGSMIDLCTGNGAIALLAAAHASREAQNFTITAVDAAVINPDGIAGHFPDQASLLKQIIFKGSCRVEDIDFPDDSFDLVTSQYGVEYCDWAPAAGQIARILKPGGKLVMVNHTATSDIMKFMEQEQREYAMLERAGFFASIDGYLKGITSYGDMRQTLLELHRNLSMVVQRGGTPLFRSVHGMLGGVLAMDQQALEKGRVHLQAYYDQTRFGFDRLEDMLRVNRAIQAEPAWYQVFTDAGLKLEEQGEIQYRERHHAGAYFKFIKRLQGELP